MLEFYISSRAFQVPEHQKSSANKMPRMKRRELTTEEVAEAERLYAAWRSFKEDNSGATQEWLAAESGLGTQGAVGQYLRAKIPLNIVALVAICRVIGADPSVISPRLTETVRIDGGKEEVAGTSYAWSAALDTAAKTAREQRLLVAHRVSGPDGRAALDALVDQLLRRTESGK